MFDPSELTVKSVCSRLPDLDLDGLEAVLEAEIDGKHRSSLIAEIGRAIDEIKTAEEDAAEEPEEEAAPEPAAEEPVAAPVAATPRRTITQSDWYKLPRHQKKRFATCGGGLFMEK